MDYILIAQLALIPAMMMIGVMIFADKTLLDKVSYPFFTYILTFVLLLGGFLAGEALNPSVDEGKRSDLALVSQAWDDEKFDQQELDAFVRLSPFITNNEMFYTLERLEMNPKSEVAKKRYQLLVTKIVNLSK